MNITLSPETLKRINEKVQMGDFENQQAVVEHAVTFFLDYQEDEMNEEESRLTRRAIDEALEQAQHGKGISLEEFDKTMRAKYGIQH